MTRNQAIGALLGLLAVGIVPTAAVAYSAAKVFKPTLDLFKNLESPTTLMGTDLNTNGVRDDIEGYIQRNIQHTGAAALSYQYAKTMQKIMMYDVLPQHEKIKVAVDYVGFASCLEVLASDKVSLPKDIKADMKKAKLLAFNREDVFLNSPSRREKFELAVNDYPALSYKYPYRVGFKGKDVEARNQFEDKWGQNCQDKWLKNEDTKPVFHSAPYK